MKQRLRPVRVGVVGAGALGFHHIRLLKKIDGADLRGFYDHNPVRSAQVATELETTAFPSLEALLDHVEAVTVVVPTPAHVDVGVPVPVTVAVKVKLWPNVDGLVEDTTNVVELATS